MPYGPTRSSWQKDSAPRVNTEGRLRIPSIAPGACQLLLVRVENGQATQFSPIQSVDLKAGETQKLDLQLHPSVSVVGRLSDDVPRPVRNGRVVARAIQKDHSMHGVDWSSWAAVADDGTFTLEGWPSDQAIQLIALCDGYIAQSGAAPEEVGTPPRNPDPFLRPQVFRPEAFNEVLTVPMEPMVLCDITVVDDQGVPLRNAQVTSCPNVCWWNDGSQIYCDTLFRSVACAQERDYHKGIDDSCPFPFTAVTDEQGVAKLYMPAERGEWLYVQHDKYELPILLGNRKAPIKPIAGKPTQTRLVLQPKGKEFLGEWDKLAGVLFGCTGEQCRRLLEDPGFRERITAVRVQFDEAEDLNDPKLLKNAFAEISAAFDEVGDKEEVTRWRRKADEQAAKLKAK